MQDLNECRVAKLNTLWTLSASLESACHKRCTEHLSEVISEIERNLPHLDSVMYVEHNNGVWNEPPEFDFEPSLVWHDTDEIVVDDPAQIFLRNMMTKSRKSLEEVKPDLEKKRRDIEGFKKSKDAIKLDESKATNDAEVTRVGAESDLTIIILNLLLNLRSSRGYSMRWKILCLSIVNSRHLRSRLTLYYLL